MPLCLAVKIRRWVSRESGAVLGMELLMRLLTLLKQCPACLARLIWMVLEMGSRWSYSSCFEECCFQDLFNVALLHPYCSMNTIAAWTKNRFISSDMSGFEITERLSIADHAFASRVIFSKWDAAPAIGDLSTSFIYIYIYIYVLLWTPTYGRAKAGRPARTYIQQLCEDTGCSPARGDER